MNKKVLFADLRGEIKVAFITSIKEWKSKIETASGAIILNYLEDFKQSEEAAEGMVEKPLMKQIPIPIPLVFVPKHSCDDDDIKALRILSNICKATVYGYFSLYPISKSSGFHCIICNPTFDGTIRRTLEANEMIKSDSLYHRIALWLAHRANKLALAANDSDYNEMVSQMLRERHVVGGQKQ